MLFKKCLPGRETETSKQLHVALGDPKLINILPSPSELFHGQSESSADIEFMNEICKVENQNGYRVQE